MLAITQYYEGHLYSYVHVERLAIEMKAKIRAMPDIKLDMYVSVKNAVAIFKFQCVRENESGECDTFLLVSIKKLQPMQVGAEIVVGRDCLNLFRQGDIAVLVKDEGSSGWWAKFNSGETWNVGSGADFFVLA
ncbi:hypothetical protein OCF84_21285 (plasmid) [Shewanella xiamenensis]|uniref:Uncharacterized protein n=1 Tax=Shewanella xiamenensis TaxID=332186 RepID=A0ABT6UH36_9GAMM|nr:hypothetical protein [Shewanella xiamenensis]MDI5832589.1 hypothetical protein [Shewanella xiamenensis]WHF57793.1 hypothetical protein OCF84_21285 [Shewanella xiamenensis]